ncbi:N-acetylmuramoyl-L-alanine amidase, partial [Streptomyces sp. SID11233]|nr:N-acetylmuramoyl-L-alanine amidase [Streptomyces sp. SID11233]
MSAPLSAARMLAALRAEGLDVVEHPGWRTHSRTGPGRPWGPVHG